MACLYTVTLHIAVTIPLPQGFRLSHAPSMRKTPLMLSLGCLGVALGALVMLNDPAMNRTTLALVAGAFVTLAVAFWMRARK